MQWKSERAVLTPEESAMIHEASLHISGYGYLMPLDEAKYDRLQDLGVKWTGKTESILSASGD